MKKRLLTNLRKFWMQTELHKIVTISVLGLALIVFLILSITSTRATKTHQDTVIQSCSNYTDFVMHSTETELNIIYNTLHEFMKDPVALSAKNIYRDGKIDNDIAESLSDLLRSTIASNNVISDIVITFKDAPLVVSHNGIYSQEYYRAANPSYSALADFNAKQSGYIHLESHLFYTPDMTPENATRNLVLFYTTDWYRVNIVVNSTDFISAFDISHFYSEDMLIMVTNASGKLILSNDYEKAATINLAEVDEDEYLVSTDTDRRGLNYSILYSKDIIKKDVNAIRNYFIVAFIITLIMFGVFIILYNKLWVTPLKNFAKNFLLASGNGTKNELVALLDYVDTMNKQIFEMSDYILYTKDNTTNAMMINAILYNSAKKDDSEYNAYESNFFKDSFPYEKFMLVHFITGSLKESISTGLSVVLDGIKAKYEFCFISDDGFFAVINFNGSSESIKTTLKKFIDHTNRIEVCVEALISDAVDSIDKISGCTELLSSIKNARNVRKTSKLYTKTDIATDRKLLENFMREEETFANLIMVGDGIKLRDMLSKIFMNESQLSYGDSYRFFIYLHNFIIRINSQLTDFQESETLPFLTLLSKGTLSVMDYDKLKNAFCETCMTLCNRADNNQSNYDNEIIRFIKENYNHFISLDMVAQKFGMNPSYLSTYIKKKIGMSFVEYMRTLRINNARKLLTETDLDISKISESLGFTDTSSFIRYFKKSEGITPKQYRTTYSEK